MKLSMTRNEVIDEFDKIIKQYGKPQNGEVFHETQLIAKIVHDLSGYDETNIIYENSQFYVSPNSCVKCNYADDHKFIGTVKANEWFTSEQLKALHELCFGYQF